MKIAIVRLPKTYAKVNYPPVGINYLASYLRQNGHECLIIDTYVFPCSEEETLLQISNYAPDAVGISAMTHEVKTGSKIAFMIKQELNIPVIVGGCHITALPKETMEEFHSFDYGIYGEGEQTLLDLLKYLEGFKDIQEIKGLVYRNGAEVIVNEPRPFLSAEELNQLPMPDFDQYYNNPDSGMSEYPVAATRGCPFACIFCMQVLGRKVRQRSPENLLYEIQHAVGHYGITRFNFLDEIFLLDNESNRKFLNLLIETGISNKIEWYGCTRVNFVNHEIITLAKRAGCKCLNMGIESGDNQILKKINKGFTVDEAANAVKIIKESKIELNTYFILGHPDENIESANKTVDFAVKLNTTNICVGVMVPYPGTIVYQMALNGEGGYKLLTDDWSCYDKYFVNALEFKDVPYQILNKLQKYAVLKLYIMNFRLKDLAKYILERREFIAYLIKEKLKSIRLVSLFPSGSTKAGRRKI